PDPDPADPQALAQASGPSSGRRAGIRRHLPAEAARQYDLRYSSSAMRSASDRSMPQRWPPLPSPVRVVSTRQSGWLQDVSTANPNLTGSYWRAPSANVLGRRSGGSSRSYKVGTEPLCRNGAAAQIP